MNSDGTKRLSTKQLLVKIPNYPRRFRHSINGTYYGIKKINGKKKDHSLERVVAGLVFAFELRMCKISRDATGGHWPCRC